MSFQCRAGFYYTMCDTVIYFALNFMYTNKNSKCLSHKVARNSYESTEYTGAHDA